MKTLKQLVDDGYTIYSENPKRRFKCFDNEAVVYQNIHPLDEDRYVIVYHGEVKYMDKVMGELDEYSNHNITKKEEKNK